MNPPPNERVSPPWLLFVGLLLGGGLLVLMAWDSLRPASRKEIGRAHV